MRKTKREILNGLTAYIDKELLPKLGDEKGLRVALDVAVHMVQANNRLADAVFNHPLAAAALRDDGTGSYEVGELLDALEASVRQYGELPVQVPPIPCIAPTGCTISLHAADIQAIRGKIGGDDGRA